MTGAPPTPSETLGPECRVLTRYLAGAEASPYVLEKYQAGHAGLRIACGAAPTWFDNFLLAVASRGPLGAGLVDSYTRWFSQRSVVRYKLTLLLAVLENSPGFYHSVTSATVGKSWAVFARLTFAGLREAVVLLVGVVIFGPLNLVAAATRRKPR
jgi:hypothetical protein